MDRIELADALLQGDELGSPTGASRPPSWSNIYSSVSRAAAADDQLGAEGRLPLPSLTAAMRGE